MTTYLLLVTLGPIQEFIAAARRTRDLWAGSQLLSALSRKAARLLQAEGAELIFPAQADLDHHEVVNRILATMPVPPEQLGARIEEKLRKTLRRWAQTNLEGIPGLKEAGTLNEAVGQVTELLEIFWAGVERTADYQADRDNLEAALAARKNTRAFAQPAYRAMVPKSSIDGVRESVIPEKYFPSRGDSDDDRRQKVKQLFELFGAGQAERMSGVDLLKRHARGEGGEADFPSTSHFAALPLLWRRHEAKKDIRYGLSRYLDTLRAAYDSQDGERQLNTLRLNSRFKALVSLYNYDASILFASRLEEELEGPPLNRARDALITYLREGLGDDPEPYYAILHADGDNMGKVIDHQAKQGIAQHQAFSRDLDAFAGAVREIVEGEAHRGALVYAGGDDVLAFLPLDTVLQCAQKLSEQFAHRLARYQGKQSELATLSVGIAICHHIEPLSDALNLARKAEQDAKKVKGKNGLAIMLSKRSGADTTVSSGWRSGFAERLELFIRLHQADAMPDGAAFDLRDLDERVGRTLAPEALTAEALRILERKRGGRGRKAVDPDSRALIASALHIGASKLRPDGRPIWGVNELADELIVTREFARARGPRDLTLEEEQSLCQSGSSSPATP